MTKTKAPRKGLSAPTIDDVAKHAGVSPMTVSRVLNHVSGVRQETRDRVSLAIKELGYVRNAAASSLAGAQHCRVALVYSNPSTAYLGELLIGALEQARESDVELLIEPYDDQYLVARLTGHRIDGVLVPAPLCDDRSLIETLHAADIEVVQIATGSPQPTSHAISIDDESAARAMTAHLMSLGHRRIAFIEGPADQTTSKLRRDGYDAALQAAGVAPDAHLIEPGDFSFHSGLIATERLLSLDPRPTAIFASNDDMAAAAINVAHRLGIAVPHDLSICGFDDTALARTLWPQLTTIKQPVAAMAGTATRILVDAVRAKRSGALAQPARVRLDFEVVERGSAQRHL